MDMEFDEDELNGFSAGGMIKAQAGVKVDKNSGLVTGWDSIWSILEQEDKAKVDVSEAQGIVDGMKKKKGEEKTPEIQRDLTVDAGLANLNGYKSVQIDATNFVLKHPEADTHQEYKLELVEEGGKVEFKGIPDVMKKYLLSFDNTEIKQ